MTVFSAISVFLTIRNGEFIITAAIGACATRPGRERHSAALIGPPEVFVWRHPCIEGPRDHLDVMLLPDR